MTEIENSFSKSDYYHHAGKEDWREHMRIVRVKSQLLYKHIARFSEDVPAKTIIKSKHGHKTTIFYGT